MRIESLKYILEIAQLGSISAVSKKLCIGQTTLSAAVRSVENELKILIFSRTQSGVQLTERGASLIPRFHGIVWQYDNLIRDLGGDLRDRSCTVACYPMLCSSISPFLSAELTGSSELSLNICNVLSHKTVNTLINGVGDIGIAAVSPAGLETERANAEKNGLNFEILYTDRFAIFAGAQTEINNCVSFLEMQNFKFCTLEEYPMITDFYPGFDAKIIDVRTIVPSLEAIERILISTDQITFAPRIAFHGDPYIRHGLIKEVQVNEEGMEIINFMVSDKKRGDMPMLKDTMGRIRTYFAEAASNTAECTEK